MATFFLFASKITPWVQFHYFSEPAILFYSPEPDFNNLEDERKYRLEIEKKGGPVVLKLNSGKSMPFFAHLSGDEAHRRAKTQEGLPVIFTKNGIDSVRAIESLDELESPWIPFFLFIPFLMVSIIATRIFLREING